MLLQAETSTSHTNQNALIQQNGTLIFIHFLHTGIKPRTNTKGTEFGRLHFSKLTQLSKGNRKNEAGLLCRLSIFDYNWIFGVW